MQAMHGGDVYRNKISLDFSINVNPLGISEEIKSCFNNIEKACVAYPDPENEALRVALAEKHRVKPNQVVCGNGASEILMGLVHAIRPRKALIPIPAFSGYERAALVEGTAVKFLHLKEERGFAVERDLLGELENEYDMLFLANPSNPVGQLVDDELLCEIMDKCEEKGTWLVLDSCFIDFVRTGDNIDQLISKYKKLVIVKAFTKYYGVPGIRLGYAVASDMRMLMKLKMNLPEWNISVLAQNVGLAALNSEEHFAGTIDLIAKERKYLTEELKSAFADAGRELKLYPGQANFIMFKTDVKLYDLLLQKEILIRNCSNYRTLGRGYYRIAVKLHEDNEALIAAIKEVLRESANE